MTAPYFCEIGRAFDPNHPTCQSCGIGCALKSAAAANKKRIEYDITPVAKPRMTQRDKWKKRPSVEAYHEYCDKVRRLGLIFPLSGAAVTFIMPMPPSWPEKKKLNLVGKAHQLKPDVDNLLKGLMDAVFEEDCQVWNLAGLTKLWGRDGRIIIQTK